MKRYIFMIFAALVAVGCHASLSTDTYMDEIAMPAGEGSADSLLMSISLEYITSGPLKESVNNAIVTRSFDLTEDWDGSLEEAATLYREDLIDEYLTDNGGFRTSTWEDRIEGVFSGRYKNWINYILTYYSYKGSAYGIQTVSPIVFDAVSGKVVSEEDLFADGYTEPVAALLREAVKASMEKEDEELLELVTMELVVPNGNFSVGPGGVEWVFQPYDVGPYALGIVSASLDWKQLKPYLK